jgi:hypothetical protein
MNGRILLRWWIWKLRLNSLEPFYVTEIYDRDDSILPSLFCFVYVMLPAMLADLRFTMYDVGSKVWSGCMPRVCDWWTSILGSISGRGAGN